MIRWCGGSAHEVDPAKGTAGVYQETQQADLDARAVERAMPAVAGKSADRPAEDVGVAERVDGDLAGDVGAGAAEKNE